MSEIALYNALTKLGLEPNEAREAVDDVASSKEVATKTDISEIKTEIANLETRLTWRMIVVVGIAVAILRLSLM